MASTIAKILEIIGIVFTYFGGKGLFQQFCLDQKIARLIRLVSTKTIRISRDSQTGLYHQLLETWLTNWFIAAIPIIFLLLLGLVLSQSYLLLMIRITILFYLPFGFLLMLTLSNLLPIFIGVLIYYPLKYLVIPFYRIEKYIKEHHLETVITLIGVVVSIIAALIR